jgi:AcrR family transcriptional regulator
MTIGGPGVAQRGRPRSEKARTAIVAAAAELLLDRGLSAVSMDAVAERAGVSKATIYRWWPTKESLALDALFTEWAAARPEPRDTGSLRGDLLSLLRPWIRLATSRPYGRVLAALITEAQTDPAFAAEYRQRLVEPRRDQARAIFRRAIDRGEIPADTKVEVALDLLYGPMYHRLLHGHAPLNDGFVRDVVDMALGGIQPAESLRPRGSA